MLVLTRKRNEKLVLMTSDGPVEVQLTQIRGDAVRLGITAPATVKVLRGELVDEDGRPRGKAA
jgi:carbon storage regulator CsrA